MNTHPLTLLVGAICLVAIIVLVSLGLSCAAYQISPDDHKNFKPYYEYSKTKKLC